MIWICPDCEYFMDDADEEPYVIIYAGSGCDETVCSYCHKEQSVLDGVVHWVQPPELIAEPRRGRAMPIVLGFCLLAIFTIVPLMMIIQAVEAQ